MSLDKLFQDILTSLYQNFFASLLLAVLFLYVYNDIRKRGITECLKDFWNSIKNDKTMWKSFILYLYIALLLFQTLLGRPIWRAPLSNVMGNWTIYSDGVINSEAIENIILFFPMPFFIPNTCKSKINLISDLYYIVKIAFFVSLTIEGLQLLFLLGTFQVSDLFYNTTGALMGEIGNILLKKCRHTRKG